MTLESRAEFGNTDLSELFTKSKILTLNQVWMLFTEIKSTHLNAEKEKLLNLLDASISQK